MMDDLGWRGTHPRDLPVCKLNELLDYNPETGKLYWKERSADWFTEARFTKEGRAKQWNSTWAGKEALGSQRKKDGYLVGKLLGYSVKAHQVILAMQNGKWPKIVDHINGNPADNRLENLRDVTYAENAQNYPLRRDNRSGHPGVFYSEREERWKASIRHRGAMKYLGTFKSKSQAIAKRKEAERELGFHENHGRAKS